MKANAAKPLFLKKLGKVDKLQEHLFFEEEGFIED